MSFQSVEALLPRHEAFLRREPVDRPLAGRVGRGLLPGRPVPARARRLADRTVADAGGRPLRGVS